MSTEEIKGTDPKLWDGYDDAFPNKIGSILADDFRRTFRIVEKFLGKSDPATAIYLFFIDERIVWKVQRGRLVLTVKSSEADGLAHKEIAVAGRLEQFQNAVRNICSTSQVVDILANERKLSLRGVEGEHCEIDIIDPGAPPIRFPGSGAVEVPFEIHAWGISSLTKGRKKHPVFIKAVNKGSRFIIECDSHVRTGFFFDPIPKDGVDPRRIRLRFTPDEMMRIARIEQRRGRGLLTIHTSDNSCLWSWRPHSVASTVEVFVDPYVEPEAVISEQTETAVSSDDKTRLDELEQVVSDGLAVVFQVGEALREIRNSKLYKTVLGFETFEDYCRERWKIERPTAYQYIAACDVRENLSAIADTLPENEAQARPLAKLEPADQQDAWQTVLERAPKDPDGKPKVTAKLVKEVAEEVVRDDPQDGECPGWDMEHEINEVAKFITRAWSRWPRESLDLLIVQLQRFATKIEKDMEDGDTENTSTPGEVSEK